MFSFFKKKSLVKRAVQRIAFVGAVLVLLTSFFFVSCADPGVDDPVSTVVNAKTPTITIQPQSNIWDVGEEEEFELTVTASVTDGGNLSYQWYSNATNSNTGGTAINGEISATLTLDSEDYTENGSYYFYVVVTNTNNSVSGTKTAGTVSSAAMVTVDGVGGEYLNAKKPVISAQPADKFWNVFTAENGVTLSVTAAVDDSGSLTYQWYSSESANDTVNGEEINGATSNEFTLTKTAYTANGTYYFYVVITNTNNAVSGIKIVSAISDAATVTVAGYPDTGYSDTHTLPENLKGEWESEWGELFTISASEFSSGMDFGEGWSGYKGTIVNHRGNAAGTAGYITIQFTECTWDKDAEDLYYVIYYKDLTDTTVTIAGAGSFVFIDPDFGASGGRSTKEEAEATYTVSAGYFEMGSDLEKPGSGDANAQEPNITAITGYPTASAWNVTSANNFSVTVTASVTDGGTLSYQWYSNTSATTTGGTAIGTNSASLSLAKVDYPTNRKAYFYVVITNTNNNASNTKTVTKTSNAATITVTGNTTTTYYPGDAGFNTVMTYLADYWASYDEYVIRKLKDFDDYEKDLVDETFSDVNFSALKTYNTQYTATDNDYVFLYADGGYGMGYMGLIRAINIFDNDDYEGFVIIEYFEGADPAWLWDPDGFAPQGLEPGEKPYGGTWYAKVDQDKCNFANTTDQNVGYSSGEPYYTETATVHEALNKFIYANKADLFDTSYAAYTYWIRDE